MMLKINYLQWKAQIAELDNSLKWINQMAMEAEKLKEDEMAAISRQKKCEDELKLEKAKLEQRIKYEKKVEESRKPVTSNTSSTTKLPKLVISKFNGTYTEWTRFWQQYEASIGIRSSIGTTDYGCFAFASSNFNLQTLVISRIYIFSYTIR